MHILKRSLFFFSPLVFIAFSCLDDASNLSHSLVNIYLTDAPGDFDEVFLDIQRVEVYVQSGNSAGTQEWIPLDYLPLSNIVNVTKLVNESQLIIGRGELPLGKISQIKVVFGDGQYIVQDNEQLSLEFANEEEKAFILEANYPLDGGMSYDLILDIDLSKSILADQANANNFLFDPVIRSFETGNIAAIEGTVTPTDARPYVYAILGEDTVGTLTDSLGNFMLKGLQAAEYKVYFQPRPPYLDSLTTVITKLDSTAVMETVLLQKAESIEE